MNNVDIHLTHDVVIVKGEFGKSAVAIIMCPVDDTGKNSVKPSIKAMKKASQNDMYEPFI